MKVGEYRHMADKSSGLKPDKVQKQVKLLDTLAKKVLDTVDPGFRDREVLSRQDSKIQSLLADEINFSKGVSGGSMIDFINAMTAQNAKATNDTKEDDPTKLFTRDVGDIYGYFQDLYKNRYLEISDLKFISKFIPALGEAVKVTLDGIVSADDISTSISRTITFGSNLTEDEQEKVMAEIKRIEQDEKLLKKLKNITYKKALVTGSSYIYHVPYDVLFAEYDERVKKGWFKPEEVTGKPSVNRGIQKPPANMKAGFNLNKPKKPATESTSPWFTTDSISMQPAIESAIDDMGYLSASEKKAVKDSLSIPNITCNDDWLIEDAMESAHDIQQMEDSRVSPYYTQFFRSVGEISDNVDTEGSIDTSKRGTKPSKFKVSGTYLKYIDAKNIIPIRIYNTVVGYYYIHNQQAAKKAQKSINGKDTTLVNTQTIFNSASMSEKKKEQVMTDIIDTIAGGIINSFSVKFISKYSEHKKLIADCLIANGIVDNEYSIQFIPADCITPFIINEDENGNGESMLMDSLFPGKLLLSFIITKLLNYMNKSANKTIAYVGKGPIDVGSSNHIQRVIRMLQEGNITFNDLLSTNMIFSKFSRNNNIQLPKSKNNEKLVEFEVQEGQNFDMSTDMEQWLEKLTILGSGVPSVIMEYTDVADYSRSIVTANIKQAARVACYQSDLEEPTTEVYKALVMGSTLDPELKKKACTSLKFNLSRPKVLSNANVAEYLDTINRSADAFADMMIGQDTTQSEIKDPDKVKAKFKKKYITRNAPFLDMDEIEEDLRQAILEVRKVTDYDRSNQGLDDNLGGGEDMGDLGNPGGGFGEDQF